MLERSRPRIRPKPKRERVREGESKRKLLLVLVGVHSHPILLWDFVARCTIYIDRDIILMDASLVGKLGTRFRYIWYFCYNTILYIYIDKLSNLLILRFRVTLRIFRIATFSYRISSSFMNQYNKIDTLQWKYSNPLSHCNGCTRRDRKRVYFFCCIHILLDNLLYLAFDICKCASYVM